MTGSQPALNRTYPLAQDRRVPHGRPERVAMTYQVRFAEPHDKIGGHDD
jgi:hypothetical protein